MDAPGLESLPPPPASPSEPPMPLPVDPPAQAATAPHAPSRWWIPLLVVVAAAWVAFQIRNILTPFLLAFLLAYALDPIVVLLEKLKVPRAVGALLVFGGLIAGTIAGAGAITRFFSDEVIDLVHEVPDKLVELQRRTEPWIYQHLHFRVPHTAKELFSRYGDKIKEQLPTALHYVQEGLFGTVSALAVAVSLLIVPLFAFYLLIDFDRIVERGGKLVPRRWQREVFDAMGEIHQMLGGYVRGQLLAMIVLSALYAAGLEWTGLRLAIPIGVLTGMMAFVPYIGFFSGLTLAASMALLEWHSALFLVHVVAVMIGVQALDGVLVTPRVVGRSVGLGPVEVLLAMAAAGTLFGFFGILLAVPIGATVKIVLVRLTHAYERTDFYRRTQ